MNKFLSRKFLIAVAAFLASLGASITGFTFGSEGLAIAGAICCAVSAAIYAACEAYVDAADVRSYSKIENVTKTVTATSADKATVVAAFKSEGTNEA